MSDADAAVVTALAEASNRFAFELWRALGPPRGNLAVSPASITAALAMTYGGAAGATATEMARVLHLDGGPAPVMAAWGALATALQDPRYERVLRIANRLFGEQTFQLSPAYLEATRAAYGAAVEAVDFKGAADAQRLLINAWVAEQTQGRITDLLPPGALGALTRLVLVNAIYFLAAWAEPFDRHRTAPRPFSPSPGVEVQTPTMHAFGRYRCVRQDGVTVLALPYKGRATMLVILPDERHGLAAVEATLDAARLATWRSALGGPLRRVAVALPSFRLETPAPLELSAALSALGMPSAFDEDRADFRALAALPGLAISQVFHKAFVRVDERGTEAAGATAVVMTSITGAPAPEPYLSFVADHPFLFVILDDYTGLALFMGRVTDPH